MPAYKGIRKQFALENDAELKWQIDIKDRYVECRCMCDRIHAWLGVVEAIITHARDFHRRQDRLHHEPGPEVGEFVLAASVAVEERTDQRNRAQNDGVGPDQRGKNKIRAQAAKPAMAVDGRSSWLPLRRRDGRIRPSTPAQLGFLLFQLRSCSDFVHDL